MRRPLAIASSPIRSTVLAALVASAPLAAQEPTTTQGFNVGLHLSGQSMTIENGNSQGAGGVGLIVGYGVNRSVEIFLQLDGGQFDVQNQVIDGSWTLGHADIGVRYHFASAERNWAPFLQAALTRRSVTVSNGSINQLVQSQDITISGSALTLGGGLSFYFNPAWALDLQLAWSEGNFTDVAVGGIKAPINALDARTARFNIGASWWP